MEDRQTDMRNSAQKLIILACIIIHNQCTIQSIHELCMVMQHDTNKNLLYSMISMGDEKLAID